jgi:hypothetical protein
MKTKWVHISKYSQQFLVHSNQSQVLTKFELINQQQLTCLPDAVHFIYIVSVILHNSPMWLVQWGTSF